MSGETIGVGISEGAVIGGPLWIGQSFSPRYRILQVLGVGGMGAVYQAWDAELSVAVALKAIRTGSRSASPDAEKRFKQELILARQVTHRNVVRIHDLGEIDGIKYITMPYIKGDDLSTILRRDGKLPVARALRIARQVAAGLAAAHEAGVVHRDLKPANVMIGADDLALIMDFGISASSEEATTGGFVGTLEYMAPEQSTGAAVDGRADIFAFGLILYEMLTGPRVVAAATPQERLDAMKQRIAEGVPPARSLDDTIPVPLDALVTRCLERDPAARFATTAELVAGLAALDDAGELIPIYARISKRMMAAAAALLLVLLGATYFAGRRLAPLPATAHDPVSVVIADFRNGTGEPEFDRTLEPMLKLALEGTAFISAYDRIGIVRNLGLRAPETLDERAALEFAVQQGLGVVLSGALDRQGSDYGVSVKATQAATGNIITTASSRASNKEQVLAAAMNLVNVVREALGDTTSDSDKQLAMATLSATSFEVVREYAKGMDAVSRSSFDEALQNFSKAVALDPNFGLGYAGLAMSSRNLDKQQDAEHYAKEAVRHLDSLPERERYRTRGLSFMISLNYEACQKEFGDLIARYPADASARNNRAICLTFLRNMPLAVAEMGQVVKILPSRALYRENLMFYADYSGDFQTAERHLRVLEQPGEFAMLAVAFARLGQGQVAEAIQTYEAIGRRDALGSSIAASGLGDLALYEGRFTDAQRILTEGVVADLPWDSDRATGKFAVLAYTQLLRQQHGDAIAAAEKALAGSKAVRTRFLAARVFVETGAIERARTLAAGLASEVQAEPRAHAKIIDGDAALKSGDARQAINALTEANTLLDTWIGHFDLGRAYLDAGEFTHADAEFDLCLKRRGEALALFLDEEPTYGFFPPVYYYQGRAREGLKSAGAAESYRAYLAIRGQSTEDPLLPEVRRGAGR